MPFAALTAPRETAVPVIPHPEAIAVPPGVGTEYSVVGQSVRCLLGAEQTGDAFSLFVVTVPPDNGPPPHIHDDIAETFFVLSGTFEFFADGRHVTGGTGTCVHVPIGVLHTFRNAGPETATLMVIISPGGFERFFAEMDALPAGPPDMGRLLEIAARHQVRYALPSRE